MRRHLTAAAAAAALCLGLYSMRGSAALDFPGTAGAEKSVQSAPPVRRRAPGLRRAKRALCPADMVLVASKVCVDRFEAAIQSQRTGKLASPYYSANPSLAARDVAEWDKRRLRTGPHAMRSLPLPPLPREQLTDGFVPVAVARRGVLPAAYVDLSVARQACTNAGKRLCRHTEWLTACRGESHTPQPYGDKYEPARCNVNRGLHPASVLHSLGEFGGTDPRMNTIQDHGFSLLLETGSLDDCVSRWQGDAIHDMVGNLDEWIDNPRGTFLGGFYARDMPWGCDARIEIHSADYYDYSTGFRCCKDLAP